MVTAVILRLLYVCHSVCHSVQVDVGCIRTVKRPPPIHAILHAEDCGLLVRIRISLFWTHILRNCWTHLAKFFNRNFPGHCVSHFRGDIPNGLQMPYPKRGRELETGPVGKLFDRDYLEDGTLWSVTWQLGLKISPMHGIFPECKDHSGRTPGGASKVKCVAF